MVRTLSGTKKFNRELINKDENDKKKKETI